MKVKINGVYFTIKGSKFTGKFSPSYENLYQAYNKPSEVKQDIFKEWRLWYCNTDDALDFGIGSRNVYQFTLGCNLYNASDKPFGVVSIRKSACEIMPYEAMNAKQFAEVLRVYGYEVER